MLPLRSTTSADDVIWRHNNVLFSNGRLLGSAILDFLQAARDSRVQICIENCIPEMPLGRQLVHIIGRNKFSIRFESLCGILRVSSRTRMSQNQAKSNYKDCSFGNRDSLVKCTRLSVLLLANSQAGRKFEVLEAAFLVNIYIYWVGQTPSF